MFDTHQPQIASFARLSPDNLYRVVASTIASMGWPTEQWLEFGDAAVTHTMSDHWEYLDRPAGTTGAYVVKRYKTEYYKSAWRQREATYAAYLTLEPDAFHTYLVDNLPGIAATKAAFIVQMTHGCLGCIDSRNLRTLGLAKTPSNPAKYRELVDSIKPSSDWWDDWCRDVASDPKRFPVEVTPEYVSAGHVHIVTGE